MEIRYSPRIARFIEALEKEVAVRVYGLIGHLERYGYELPMPLSKNLGKGLFELRLLGKNSIRIFYCFIEGKAFLLHAILKKSKKTPKKDIEYARKLKDSLYNDNV